MSEWLKNLKAGDKVFVRSNSGKSLETVQRVTPKGRIVVNNVLYTNGKNCSNMWSILSLEEATEEKVNKFVRTNFVRNIFKAVLEKKGMTYEQAKQINELLDLGVVEQ